MHRLTLAATLLSTALAQQTFWQESFQLNFNYNSDSQVGPDGWGNVDTSNSEWEQYADGHPLFNLDINGNECDLSSRPSPIALDVTDTCSDVEMWMRQKDSTDCVAKDVSFEITPNTLRAYFPDDDSTCQRPSLQMDGSGSDDNILQFMEIHARSEHVVNGRRFDAELQMAHMGTDSSDDRMVIVSVLIDASARGDHVEFQYMLDQWQVAADALAANCGSNRRTLRTRDMVANKASVQQTINANDPVKPPPRRRRTQECTGSNCGPRIRMFPYSMWPSIWYYKYGGSLTTPPCSTIARWRIIDKPMTISRKQYKQLATLLTAYKDSNCENGTVLSPTGENFRPLATINTNFQTVQHCTQDDFDLTLYDPSLQ
jgi:carbonic anhydrase